MASKPLPSWPANQIARFWSRVAVASEDECWPFIGRPKPDGYMQVRMGGRNQYPHRVSVFLSGRDIADGMAVDHICRNRACCNPGHLRVVDRATNAVENSISVAALNAQKTHCVRGHPFSGDNLAIQIKNGRPKRRCRECCRIYDQRDSR